jgi:hypothetical protein
MQSKHFIRTTVVLFVTALLWNGALHTYLLHDLNQAVQTFWRADLGNYMWLSLLMTLGIICLFVWGYARMARRGSLKEGVTYGLAFALLVGLLVDLNQYILYPLPADTVLAWFAAGILEFVLYGIITSCLYPVTDKRDMPD